MNEILIIILLILMVLIGKKRGFKSFISLIINFFLLIITFYFIALGINPIIVSLIGCICVSYIILFFVNGKNEKTEIAMKSVVIVLFILIVFIFLMTNLSRIAGFGSESYEEINMFSYDVNLDFTNVTIALILIGLIGATIDTAIAISSAIYEVYQNNKKITTKELYLSGINIGKDIIASTTNTLLFAFLGEFMTLLIWFKMCNYSGGSILNNKSFVSEFIKIMFSATGCVLIIPLTSLIASYKLKNEKILNFKKLW